MGFQGRLYSALNSEPGQTEGNISTQRRLPPVQIIDSPRYQREPTTLFSSALPSPERALTAQLGEGCHTLDWKTKRGELTGHIENSQ